VTRHFLMQYENVRFLLYLLQFHFTNKTYFTMTSNDKKLTESQRLNKLKLAYLQNRDDEYIAQEFFCLLAKCLAKTIHKRKYDISWDEANILINIVLNEIDLCLKKDDHVLALAQVILRNQYCTMIKNRPDHVELNHWGDQPEEVDSFHQSCMELEHIYVVRLKQVICSLKYPDNVLVYFSFFKKKSQKELAENLAIPYGNIRMRVKRAKKKFMKVLKGKYKNLYTKLQEALDREEF